MSLTYVPAPSSPRDRFWTERMVMGVLLIGGFILTGNVVLILLAMGKSIPETTGATILSGFTAAIGVIVGATFRNDRTDRISAENAATVTQAMVRYLPAPTPPTLAPPQPVPAAPVEVTVTNERDHPIPVQTQEGQLPAEDDPPTPET